MAEQNENEMEKSLTPAVGEGSESSSCYALPLGLWEFGNGQGISFLIGVFGLFKKSLERCNISKRVISPALVQMFKISELIMACVQFPISHGSQQHICNNF